MHLADLKSYLEADARLVALYNEPDAWVRKSILNIAASGKILQRPHNLEVRGRNLARATLFDPMRQ